MHAHFSRGALSILALIAAVVLQGRAGAQLTAGGTPPSLIHSLAAEVPTVDLEPLDVETLLAEDALAGKNEPFRFGDVIDVELGLDDSGVWETLPDGGRVWRLRIRSDGAFSLSPLFSAYSLPSGAELFVYNDDLATIRGAYTYVNNKENGQFAIEPTAGAAITLEYHEPAWVEAPGEIELSGVVYDYRDVIAIFEQGDDGAIDGSCEIDVVCPIGDPWQDQIRATTLLINGGLLCSGSLVNNTNFDGTQLYFSANHCGVLNNAVFRFKYQKSGCGTGGAPTGNTVQGSVQLATSSSIDYRLVRITEAIPDSYEPYYAGWDRSGSFPANTVTVHHPGGGPKKISFDFDSPLKSGQDWRILVWDVGVTEPGSSGCPLYNQDGRFIGQLWGGAAFCGFPFDDFYGRLDVAWNQVKAHLDPLGANPSFIDGYDPLGGGGGLTITSIVPSSIDAVVPGTAQTVTINGSGFLSSASISVDGALLTGIPSPYTVVDSSTITFDMPQINHLGTTPIDVTVAGQTASGAIDVVAPSTPKLQVNSGNEPVVLLTFQGVDITMSSEPNDIYYLFYSTSNLPSSLPGIVDMDIGAGGTSLFQVGIFTIDPTQAWTAVHFPLSGAAIGLTVYVQGVTIPAG
ncbi:MAG: IPT/TIG domain-containing protein, partial [Planctomycetota bacterium]|nr:IPT/TIG domain-containing protein [Planctomycetota bacterium]